MEPLTEDVVSETLISDYHDKCFRSLTELTVAIQRPVRDFGNQLPLWEVNNEFDRYKIWASNVGAMHRGRRYQISLDYRLSEAAFYRQQVMSFLKTLDFNVQKALALVLGRRKPAEEDVDVAPEQEKDSAYHPGDDSDHSFEDSPWEISDSDSFDDTTDQMAQSTHQSISIGARKPTMEIPHILTEINFTITCLYKLPLRDPAPLDRFVDQRLANMSIYQHFDILYVKDKFPSADSALATRLGKLVTRRRQLLASRSIHDQRLTPGNTIPEEISSDTNTKPDTFDILRKDDTQKPAEAAIVKAPQSQLSGSRQTIITKASILRKEVRSNIKQGDSLFEIISEYAPSMASSYGAKLHVKVPDRPRDKAGEELVDFKCPHCFIVSHVENRERWKKHVLRDLRPYICTFQGCELYEHLFDKRNDWFQHEIQNHRVEWGCGQEGHPRHIDQAAFLDHMSSKHDATMDAAQSSIFLTMFERPKHTQTGTCCLCLREAENLKTHLAHHLEQIALFALPRENEIPEMDSGVNVRGSTKTLPERQTSPESTSEPNQPRDKVSLQDRDEHDTSEKEDTDDEIEPANHVVAVESELSAESFSWAEVYQQTRAVDVDDDRSKLIGFAVNSETLREAQDDQREKILRWENPADPSAKYHKVLEEGSHFPEIGKWLIESPSFSEWKTTPGSCLWVYGLPGCGKTVLSSLIIKEIYDHRPLDHTQAVLYFYFDFNDVEKQRYDRVIRSLISQLLSQCSRMPQAIQSLYSSSIDGNCQPKCESLLVTLHQIMRSFKETYLVIDELDACVERQELLASIEEFTSWKDANLHVLVTTRWTEDIKEAMETTPNNQWKKCIRMSVSNDIHAYICDRLQTSQTFRRWPSHVRKEIEHVVLEKAEGGFTWVAFQLNSLEKCLDLPTLRQVLASLPKTLDESYSRILCEIDEDHFQYAFKILQWLSYSVRPLELKELAEVIAIDLEESACFAPTRRFLKPKDTLAMCSNLICVEDRAVKDGDNETDGNGNRTLVRFTHFSIREYLVSEGIQESPASRFSIRKADSNIVILNDCLAYLMYANAVNFPKSQFLAEFPLAKYAAKYWTQHAQVAERQDGFDPHLTIHFLTTEDHLRNWTYLYDPDYPQSDPDRDRSLDSICPPLYYASMAGLSKSLQILLENGDDPNAGEGRYGNALQAASLEGHFEVVQLLLVSGADINAQEGYWGSALAAASFGGYVQVVQLLLDNGADVNAQSGIYGQALQAASKGGHEHLVQLLLEKGAEVNARGGHFGTALQVAASNGHHCVLKTLLEHGADVDSHSGRQALLLASSKGHDRVVKMLLEHGAKFPKPEIPTLDEGSTTDSPSQEAEAKKKKEEKETEEKIIAEWQIEEKEKAEKAKKRKQEEDEEFRERVIKTFGAAGYSQEHLDQILKQGDKGGKHEKKIMDLSRPTYIKVHRKYLSPATLDAYELPWEWDEEDPSCIIIKKWIPEHFQDILFEHTRKSKETKRIEDTTEVLKREKNRLLHVRKKQSPPFE